MEKITSNKKVFGTICGILAAVFYGTNPLGALKLYEQGMNTNSVLFSRFSMAWISSDLLALAPEDLKLYVPKEVYGKFVTDYFWGAFSGCLRPLE